MIWVTDHADICFVNLGHVREQLRERMHSNFPQSRNVYIRTGNRRVHKSRGLFFRSASDWPWHECQCVCNVWLSRRTLVRLNIYVRRGLRATRARNVIGTRPGESRPHERSCTSGCEVRTHTHRYSSRREHYAIKHAAITIIVTEKDFYASASLSVLPFNEIRIGPVSSQRQHRLRPLFDTTFIVVNCSPSHLLIIPTHQRNGTRSMHTIHMEICCVPRVSRWYQTAGLDGQRHVIMLEACEGFLEVWEY